MSKTESDARRVTPDERRTMYALKKSLASAGLAALFLGLAGPASAVSAPKPSDPAYYDVPGQISCYKTVYGPGVRTVDINGPGDWIEFGVVRYDSTLVKVNVDGDHFGTQLPVWYTAPKDIKWLIQCGWIESGGS
jgi:hypothetical protein